MKDKNIKEITNDEIEVQMIQNKQRNIVLIVIGILLIIALIIGFITDGIEFEGLSSFILLIVLILGLIVYLSVNTFIDERLRMKAIKSLSKNKNSSVENDLNHNDFNVTRTIVLANKILYSPRIHLDDNAKKVIIQYKRNRYTRVYNYSDITGYEVYENGNSVVKGSAGRSLLGGVFLGLGGAVIGSSGKRSIDARVNQLHLYIRFNDINNPQFTIKYLTSSVSKQSFLYKQTIKDIKETCAILEYIINDKKILEDSRDTEISEKETTKNEMPLEEELEKYKLLFEKGLIDEEEYKAKKASLLDL